MERLVCPHCGERFEADPATQPKCPQCGMRSTAMEYIAARPSDRGGISPGAAAILSLLFPGLGQMCQGRWWTGIAFLIVTVGLYALCFPFLGIPAHIFAVVDAARR